MTKVEEAIEEIEDALTRVRPELRGLRELRRLDLTAAAIVVVDAGIAQFAAREVSLERAEAMLKALLDNGYPEDIVIPTTGTVLGELTDDAEAIRRALEQITGSEAVSGEVMLSDIP